MATVQAKIIRNLFRQGLLSLGIYLCLGGCQKGEEVSPEEEIISPTTGTRKELTLDSIFLYASQVYLWQEGLPGYADFDPRSRYGQLNPERTAYRTELYDISQMNINPQTGAPYEWPVYPGNPKYSFMDEGSHTTTDPLALVIGASTDALLKASVLDVGNKKLAYLALGSFPELNSCQDELDQAFSTFAQPGASAIAIDLRSNGGGYVETAEYVANLLIPSRLNGKVMYTEVFNEQMQDGKATILRHQLYRDAQGNTVDYQGRLATLADVDFSVAANTSYFHKKGALETIQDVYFIVSGNTASASELLISSLKPYMNVKLVGEKTYGKPVGFFNILIDTYSFYFSSFIIQNADGWSDYLNGMEPDVPLTLPADASLGDPEEPGLKGVASLLKKEQVTVMDVMAERQIRKHQNNRMKKKTTSYIPIYKQHFKLKQSL